MQRSADVVFAIVPSAPAVESCANSTCTRLREDLPSRTEYQECLPVTLEDGRRPSSLTYIYNWPVAHLPRIASGRF